MATRSAGGPDLSALRIDDSKRRRSGGRRRGWLVAIVLVVLLVAAVAAFSTGRPIVVETVRARAAADAGPAALLNASGYVTPRRRATVAAKITGRVEQILAEEGLAVTEGQVLARLDDSEAERRLRTTAAGLDVARASVRDLEVNLANARRELQRYTNLQKEGVASTQNLDQARTSVESFEARLGVAREQVRAAEAGVAVARQDVDNCTVRAPFAGIVVSKDAQRGEMVSPISAGGGFTRTGIATLVDMTSLEIEVDVNESYIAKVRPGQRVLATLDAYPDWKIPCSVRTVIPTADRQKATVKVRISFDALDPRILPDMGVKVAFLSDEPADKAPAARALLPTAALRKDAGTTFVYLVKDGRAERRVVTAGAARGTDTEIATGLEGGETVITGTVDGLADGRKVQPKS